MKLEILIKKLQKARELYIKQHGIEPVISSFDEDEGLILCSKIIKNGSLRTHKKPYKTYRIKPA